MITSITIDTSKPVISEPTAQRNYRWLRNGAAVAGMATQPLIVTAVALTFFKGAALTFIAGGLLATPFGWGLAGGFLLIVLLTAVIANQYAKVQPQAIPISYDTPVPPSPTASNRSDSSASEELSRQSLNNSPSPESPEPSNSPFEEPSELSQRYLKIGLSSEEYPIAERPKIVAPTKPEPPRLTYDELLNALRPTRKLRNAEVFG